MKPTFFLGIVILFCSSSFSADTIHPLDVKLGLWEVTTVSKMSGMPAIPPEVLAKMTPQQRAAFEQAMGTGPNAGKPAVRKHCLTKEKLDKQNMFSDDSKSCTHTVVTSTSSKLELRLECSEKGGKSTGTFRVEAINSEMVKGSAQMVANSEGKNMNIDSNFTSRWISADCGTVK
jgi:hypothetical protein